jgi:hypothetical protein
MEAPLSAQSCRAPTLGREHEPLEVPAGPPVLTPLTGREASTRATPGCQTGAALPAALPDVPAQSLPRMALAESSLLQRGEQRAVPSGESGAHQSAG